MALQIVRLLAFLLAIIVSTFILPIACGLFYGEESVLITFIPPMIAVYAILLIVILVTKKQNRLNRINARFKLSLRGGYILVAAAWIGAIIVGAVPFVLSGYIPSITDAFFESASGFTTTGATILGDVETLPMSLNLWRTQMHWLGGMGIVALTVALMPLIGVGGFQLIKAETTGPEKGKITPKITVTAKLLWFIYLGMTLIQTALLMLTGMSFFEALAHAFATLGTGGFSTKNASIGAFNSPAVDWICITFMALSGINFSLYYQLLTGKPGELFTNTEFKAYIGILAASVVVIAAIIVPQYASLGEAVRYASFQVVSITTTTGFATADYTTWPPAAQMVIFMLLFVGGCSGSTGGSVKVVRWVILAKQAANEVRRLLHPHGVFSIRLNGRVGRKDVVFNVTAFLFLYAVLVLITTFVAACSGADLFSAFTAGATLVGNVGPGFGMISPVDNFGFFAPWAKWWFSFAMIAGRLELYTMLLFFFPSFWKK